jgi:hypothetical protein
MLDVTNTYARTGIASRLITPGMTSSQTTRENPLLRGIISRIRDASLPLEKKKELISMVWNIFKEAGDSGAAITAETIKKLYSVVDVMELAENYRLKPGELQTQQKKIDELLSYYFGQDRVQDNAVNIQQDGLPVTIDITV